MNHIYRLVFNVTHGTWKVVSELARARGKHKAMKAAKISASGGLLAPLLIGGALIGASPALAQSVTSSGNVSPAQFVNPSLTWSVGSILVGDTGTGTLSIANGGSVSSTNTSIGNGAGSEGSVTVDGAGSTWTNNIDLLVGNLGTGTLSITNGGSVSNSIGYIGNLVGSEGTVTVDGPGSTWTNNSFLNVGYFGSGTIEITNGGSVSNSNGFIGYFADSVGTATVDGASSTWTNNGELYVGNAGTGTLSITDGGAVTSTSGFIGNNAGADGKVTVEGAGSTWTDSGVLYVGRSGTGALTITNGGSVSNALGAVGSSANSVGTVTVDGAGSTWTNTGDLYVGDRGTGTLTITDGGSVSNTLGAVGNDANSVGTVKVDGAGSTWTNATDLYVGISGTGTLTITKGGSVSSSTGYVGYFAGSAGKVTVDGAGSTWANSGELWLGGSGNPTLSLTGISAGALPASTNDFATSQATLIHTTGGISGNFTTIDLGAAAVSLPDYLTFDAHKSADGMDYLLGYGLRWLAPAGQNSGSFTLADASDAFNVNVALGNRAGAPSSALIKNGAGRLTLSSANSYTGGTTINAGTLALTGTGSIAQSGEVTVNAGGTFDITGLTSGGNINNLSGAGGVALGGKTLGVVSTVDTDFSGGITGTTGSGLMKIGPGTFTLSGVNTYTGATTIIEGKLTLSGTGSIAQSSSVNLGANGTAFDIANGGDQTIRNLIGVANSNVTLGANRLTLGTADSTIFAGTISGTGGSLAKQGTGILTLSGANPYSGLTAISAGTLSLSGVGSIRNSSGVTVAAGATFDIAAANSSGLIPGNTNLLFEGARIQSLSGNGTVALGGKSLILDDAGSGGGGSFGGAFSGSGDLVVNEGRHILTGAGNAVRWVWVGDSELVLGQTGTFTADNYTGDDVGSITTLQSNAQLIVNQTFTQEVGGTLNIAIGANNAPAISAATASLDGTLNIAGYRYRLHQDASSADWYLSAVDTTPVPPAPLPPPPPPCSLDGEPCPPPPPPPCNDLNGNGICDGDEVPPCEDCKGGDDGGNDEGGNPGGDEPRRPDTPDNPPPAPEYRPEVPWATALTGLLRQGDLDVLGTLRKRAGDDLERMGLQDVSHDDRTWGRVFGSNVRQRVDGVTSPELRGEEWGFQGGVDLYQTADGAQSAGIYGAYLRAKTDVRGMTGATVAPALVGTLSPTTASLGAYWTYKAQSGFYLDAIVQHSWYSGDAEAVTGAEMDIGGSSVLGSVEVGYGFKLSDTWRLEPQAQLIRRSSDIDGVEIPNASVRFNDDDTTIGRLGLRLAGDYLQDSGQQWKPYLNLNVWHGFDATQATVFRNAGAATPLLTDAGYDSGEVGAGFSVSLTNRFSLFGEVGQMFELGGGAEVKGTSGSVGFRYYW